MARSSSHHPTRKRWILSVIAFGVLFPGMAFANEWSTILTEKGVRVETLEKENGELPAFRGTGVVNAPLVEVAVVILDTPRLPEWAHKCKESRVLQDDGEKGKTIYNRTDAPWPVQDRDVVIRSKMVMKREKREVSFVFHGVTHPKAPPKDGLVRMVTMKGHYRLRALSNTRTEVQYMIDADPGGSLPDWLIKLASEKMPLETLVKLRKQVRKMRTNPSYVALKNELIAKYGRL